MRHYTIHHQPGTQLTYFERLILGRDWNDRIEHGRTPTLRGFAKNRKCNMFRVTHDILHFSEAKNRVRPIDPAATSLLYYTHLPMGWQ